MQLWFWLWLLLLLLLLHGRRRHGLGRRHGLRRRRARRRRHGPQAPRLLDEGLRRIGGPNKARQLLPTSSRRPGADSAAAGAPKAASLPAKSLPGRRVSSSVKGRAAVARHGGKHQSASQAKWARHRLPCCTLAPCLAGPSCGRRRLKATGLAPHRRHWIPTVLQQISPAPCLAGQPRGCRRRRRPRGHRRPGGGCGRAPAWRRADVACQRAACARWQPPDGRTEASCTPRAHGHTAPPDVLLLPAGRGPQRALR